MSKAPLLLLAFLTIFIAGCDKGSIYHSSKVSSNLKVLVERQVAAIDDVPVIIYAIGFSKEGTRLKFTCPCHIGDNAPKEQIFVRIEESFTMTLLPDAEYKIVVSYWAPKEK